MGLTSSSNVEPRSATEEFERLRQRLREDLKTHEAAVRGMHSSVEAHISSTKILARHLRETKQEKRDQEEALPAAENYLEEIKNSFKSQSDTLSGTLDHLSHSLEDIICEDVLKTLSSSTSKMYMLENENRSLKFEKERLDKKTSDLEFSLSKSKNELNGQEKRSRELEQEVRTMKTKNEELRKNFNSEKSESESKSHKIWNLEQRVRDLESRFYYLEQARRVQKVTVPVQIYCDRKDDLMMRVMSELMSMLTTQMSTDKFDLTCIRCDRREDIKRDKLLLVLCINASRIGTDASNAITGIPQPDKTALLVLHHKNIHALPNQPSDRMLTTWEFKALAGIFDMAFLADKGIYACDMNNTAINGILNFVKSSVAKPN